VQSEIESEGSVGADHVGCEAINRVFRRRTAAFLAASRLTFLALVLLLLRKRLADPLLPLLTALCD